MNKSNSERIKDFARNLGVCIYDYIYINTTRMHNNISSTNIQTKTNNNTKTPLHIITYIIIYTPAKPLTFLDSLLRGCIYG